MKKTIIVTSLMSLLLLLGCSKDDASNAPADGGNGPQSQACSLVGTWSRCSNYSSTNSSRVILNVVGSQLHQTIENFDNMADCQGTADSDMAFDAVVVLGADKASTTIAGGTDAELTPDVDLFGCGANQPAYTTLKFSTGCDQFQSPSATPVCDPNNRNPNLDPDPFVKQ